MILWDIFFHAYIIRVASPNEKTVENATNIAFYCLIAFFCCIETPCT